MLPYVGMIMTIRSMQYLYQDKNSVDRWEDTYSHILFSLSGLVLLALCPVAYLEKTLLPRRWICSLDQSPKQIVLVYT